LCNRRPRRQRQAVANGAMLLVKLGAGQVVGLCRLDLDNLRHVFRDARIQSLVREEIFEGHVGVGGGNGSTAAGEIQVNPSGHEDETEQQSGDEFHGSSCFYEVFTNLTLPSASKFS